MLAVHLSKLWSTIEGMENRTQPPLEHSDERLSAPDARRLLAEVWPAVLDGQRDQMYTVNNLLKCLPFDEAAAWVREHKLELLRLDIGDPSAARSNVYELWRARKLFAALGDLVDADNGYRDRETGRKVKTILRELSRLEFGDPVNDEGDRQNLIEVYKEVRDLPIDEVKSIVRTLKRGSH